MAKNDYKNLASLYTEGVHKQQTPITENKSSMTVGTVKPGELEGETKKKGPKKSGPENTDASAPVEAPENLQGGDVEDSKKKKGGKMSKFEELYKNVIDESIEDSIESQNYDDEIQDFPPAGEEEADALNAEEEDLGEVESPREILSQIGDLFVKLADALDDGENELTGEEPELGENEGLGARDGLEEESVELEPAPDGVSKLTGKGSMNSKGVKVVKGGTKIRKGKKADGKLEKLKASLDSVRKNKVSGTGAAVQGKNTSAFE